MTMYLLIKNKGKDKRTEGTRPESGWSSKSLTKGHKSYSKRKPGPSEVENKNEDIWGARGLHDTRGLSVKKKT